MDRRKFLAWSGLGMLVSSFPFVLAACSPDAEEISSEPVVGGEAESTVESSLREDGFQAVGTVEDIETQGQILDTTANILVVQNGANLLAVSPICTHRGCTVEWEAETTAFVCPCHASIFETSGEVTSGPADSPLPVYEVKIEDNLVLVKVS